jgi:hypothetical protein
VRDAPGKSADGVAPALGWRVDGTALDLNELMGNPAYRDRLELLGEARRTKS